MDENTDKNNLKQPKVVSEKNSTPSKGSEPPTNEVPMYSACQIQKGKETSTNNVASTDHPTRGKVSLEYGKTNGGVIWRRPRKHYRQNLGHGE